MTDESEVDKRDAPEPDANAKAAADADLTPGALDAPDEDGDRATVAPPFDPIEFARELMRPSPAKGTPAVDEPAPQTPRGGSPPAPAMRPPAPTFSDPMELENARRRSLSMDDFPHVPLPSGALSLANARIPSNLPPIRKETAGALSRVDKEWVELELATRPPPALAETNEESTTSPPPAADLALLEALARGADSLPDTRRADEESLAAAIQDSVPSEVPATAQEMNDRLSLGDYSGALAIAEKLLLVNANDAEANACAENCRNVLKQMYTTRIGPLDRVPTVMVARDQLRWLSIDHRAGFVLSLIDGVSSLEMILDVSGMPELDALRILSELAQQRIIAFR